MTDHAPQPQEVACCPICDEPFQPSDLCADDITEGTCHAACLEGSPVVDMETEEEIPGGQATTYLYSEVMESSPTKEKDECEKRGRDQ